MSRSNKSSERSVHDIWPSHLRHPILMEWTVKDMCVCSLHWLKRFVIFFDGREGEWTVTLTLSTCETNVEQKLTLDFHVPQECVPRCLCFIPWTRPWNNTVVNCIHSVTLINMYFRYYDFPQSTVLLYRDIQYYYYKKPHVSYLIVSLKHPVNF